MRRRNDWTAYNFEYEQRLRIGFVGCGGHAWRNVYPAFQYAPVELVSVCDLDPERARIFARQFGAERAYQDHREMLAREDLDAVFVVTNYDEAGRPRAVDIAIDALRSGRHVWMEKPPAANVAQVEAMMAARDQADRFVMVGFKKMFFPAIRKAKEIIAAESFGPVTSVYIRYPQSLPDEAGRKDDRRMVGFLDHIVHPGSILLYLLGPIETVSFVREPVVGASVSTLKFACGAVGTMHLVAGMSGTSPLERLEVVGRGENLVVENGVKLTYYRRGSRGDYGRAADFTTSIDQAPLVWEPEFSLGQLYNKNIFMLGYAPEVQYFCECIIEGRAPEVAGLEDALELMRLYEAYRGSEGVEIRIRT